MTRSDNYYQILTVAPDASPEEIKKAFKRLARVYHPDLNPNRPKSAENQFKRLQHAYSILSDPVARHEYDQSRASNETWRNKWRVNEEPAQAITERFDLRAFWKSPFIRNLSTRRKVALCLWALCLLGSFLPGGSLVITWNDIYQVSFGVTFLWTSLPLMMVWLGTSMSDGSTYDVSPGSILKEGFGRVIEFAAWVYFARLVGTSLLGPLILLIS